MLKQRKKKLNNCLTLKQQTMCMSLYKIYINTCTYKFIYILYTLPKKKKKRNENKNK